MHIWRVDLDASVAQESSQDPPEETLNCRASLDRSRRAVGRAALTAILAAYADVDSNDIRFELGEFGKPFVGEKSGLDNIQFNLSHSDDAALIGLCIGGKLGIDVERVDPRFPFSTVVQQLSNKGLFAVGYPTQKLGVRSFFELWTRNEAYAKGTGLGLAGLAARQSNSMELISRLVDRDAWSITSFDVGSDFIGAVATTFKPATVVFHNYLGLDHVRNLRAAR